MAELSDLLTPLQDETPGQNPKFVTLVERLTARFPASPEAEDDFGQDECAWVDWPLDGETEDAVYGLGMNTARLDEVRPFVIEQALALGLAFMDEQAGEAWLPGGRRLVVPQAEGAARASKDDEVLTAKELGQLVAEHLDPVLAEYGFKRRKGSTRFQKELSNGWQEIYIENELRGASFGVIASMRLHAYSDLYMGIRYPELFPEGFNGIPACSRDLRSRYSIWTDTWGLNRWMDNDPMVGSPYSKRYKVRSRAHLTVVLGHLVLKLKTRLLPILNQCQSVRGYDAFYNPPTETEADWSNVYANGYEGKLLAAYLAKNPILERMCRFYETVEPLRYGERPTKFIEYIRAHPVPPEFED